MHANQSTPEEVDGTYPHINLNYFLPVFYQLNYLGQDGFEPLTSSLYLLTSKDLAKRIAQAPG